MTTKSEKLGDLRIKLNTLKTKVVSKEGEMKAHLVRLQKEYGINSHEEAYVAIDALDNEIAILIEKRDKFMKDAEKIFKEL